MADLHEHIEKVRFCNDQIHSTQIFNLHFTGS